MDLPRFLLKQKSVLVTCSLPWFRVDEKRKMCTIWKSIFYAVKRINPLHQSYRMFTPEKKKTDGIPGYNLFANNNRYQPHTHI